MGSPLRTVLFKPRQGSMRGQAWIHLQMGCVLKTELRLAARLGRLVTTFAYDDALQLNVPIEMRVWLPSRFDGEMQGTARYGRFRRFQVRTTDVVKPQGGQ